MATIITELQPFPGENENFRADSEIAAEPVVSPEIVTERLQSRSAELTRLHSAFIILSVASVTFLNTMGQGFLVVGIPTIASDLSIPSDLIQWPTAVYALTLGCTLLVVGTIADAIGHGPVFLIGSFLHCIFMVGCAVAQTGQQLIVFRAFQGIALSLCMPTSVGIITSNFPSGSRRNIAFACFSGGNAVGSALGLLIGGLFVDTIGWRYCYYLAVILNALAFTSGFFSIPRRAERDFSRLRTHIDWVGVTIISVSMALLSYVLT
jgi:MFS family permease